MVDAKIVEFFQGVVSKTRAGKIPWEPTAQEAKFIAAIGGQFTLAVLSWGESVPDGGPFDPYSTGGGMIDKYALVLRDEVGREVARVTDGDEGIRRDDIQELYQMARRQAVRAGERINDALEVLKSL